MPAPQHVPSGGNRSHAQSAGESVMNANALGVGTRLNKKAEHLGAGVIVNAAESAGAAFYDVVFLTGAVALGIAENELLGPSWAVLDGKAELAELLQLVELAKGIARESSARQQVERLAYRGEAVNLRNSPDNAHLTPGDDQHSGLLAAKNIRAALALRFPGLAFRVRKRGFGCVVISWADGPKESQVEALVAAHQVGYRDGSSGEFVETPKAFASVFGGADRITYKRTTSTARG